MGRDELPPTLPFNEGDEPAAGSIGRFVSVGVLGRGGMGIVIRARDPELDREVAIKVLTSRPGESVEAGRRLQREAQAMAKLSHPNVVTVYEMGQAGDERFIAMELVEGETLRQWLSTARPWQEIVSAFVACGHGLAAAHAAEIVHRDFKPENVLIGKDGRPRVGDFGLVGVEMAIAGTPAYMAPEQWLGEEADARTDVFSFCVALWEALYGARAFGDDGELRERVLDGKLAPPPAGEVPAWIEPVLRRGLAREPAERWPAMAPLLAELDRKPVRRWPVIAGGVVVAGALAAGFAIASSGSSAELCPDPEAQLATVWDKSVEAKVVTAFRAASPALADDTSKRVIAALDGYAKQWREASIGACRATHVDGTQSPDLLDRRIQCLDRRKTELAALTAALAKADRERVTGAVDAVGGLGAIDQCANVEQLQALAPPTDPALRAKVDELRADIDTLYGWRLTGLPLQRHAKAVKLVERARALHHVPILLRALDEANDAATDAGDFAAREAYLRETAQLSAEAHDDGRAARAWIDLIRLLAEHRRLDEAKTLEPVAAAAVARAGSPARLRYVQLGTFGVRKMYSEDYPGAIKNLEESVAIAETDAQRAAVQLMLAQVVHMKDGPRAATPIAEASLAITQRAYGPSHPQTAKAKHFIAQFMAEGRDLEGAAKIESEVVATLEAAYGPNHREVAMALHLLGNIEKNRGRLKEARRLYERAIVILDGTLDAGLSRGNLATVVADLDGLAAARPLFDRALRDLAPHGKDQAYYLSIEVDYAYRLLDAGACGEATPLLAHAIEELPSKRLRQLPQVLEAAAHCDVLAKRPAVALAKLERAHELCAEVECHPESATMVAFKLGRLLVETNTDRARGLSLVEAAHAAATAIGDTEQLADIDHWRKLRGRQ